MTRIFADKFIRKELKDLDVPVNSLAFKNIYDNAIEAADILTKVELTKYIEDSIESLPRSFFWVRSVEGAI